MIKIVIKNKLIILFLLGFSLLASPSTTFADAMMPAKTFYAILIFGVLFWLSFSALLAIVIVLIIRKRKK